MDSFSKEVSTGTVSDYSRGRRFRVLIPVIIALVVIIAGLWAVIASLRPLPPRIVTMATGPEGGAYYEMGKRYRELLANQGVKLQLLSTAGGIENLLL
jgi:TRAP-type uncharacterized transport system substrate-binding protein